MAIDVIQVTVPSLILPQVTVNSPCITVASQVVAKAIITNNAPISNPVSAAQWVLGEVAQGNIDGTNTVFFSANPYLGQQISVYLNGVRQNFSDYSLSNGDQVIFVTAPIIGDEITFDYIKS